MSGFMNAFVGVPQSKLAGMTILFTIVIASLFLLFGNDRAPFGFKMAVIVALFLMALPAILLTLLEINCLVVGAGMKNQRWWCGAYSWIMTFVIILYCVTVVAYIVLGYSADKQLMIIDNFGTVQSAANRLAAEKFTNAPMTGSPPSTPGANPSMSSSMKPHAASAGSAGAMSGGPPAAPAYPHPPIENFANEVPSARAPHSSYPDDMQHVEAFQDVGAGAPFALPDLSSLSALLPKLPGTGSGAEKFTRMSGRH